MKGVSFSVGRLFDVSGRKHHTYDDWGLLLASADVPPAKPKFSYVDLPGGHGTIDLSEAYGGLCYEDRELRFVLYMKPNEGLTDEAYESKKAELLQVLDGRETYLRLDTDKVFYYHGRCYIDEWASDKLLRSFVIVAKVKPFRFKCEQTFVSVNVPTGENLSVTIQNDGLPVKPMIMAIDGPIIIRMDGEDYGIRQLPDGATSATLTLLHNFVLKHGTNEFEIVVGSGDVAFVFNERWL